MFLIFTHVFKCFFFNLFLSYFLKLCLEQVLFIFFKQVANFFFQLVLKLFCFKFQFFIFLKTFLFICWVHNQLVLKFFNVLFLKLCFKQVAFFPTCFPDLFRFNFFYFT